MLAVTGLTPHPIAPHLFVAGAEAPPTDQEEVGIDEAMRAWEQATQ